MEGKLPEDQIKSVLAPWRFTLQSSGFENRLLTALELYEHFPLDIAVTGGTKEASERLAIAICGISNEKLSEEEEEETSSEGGDDDQEAVDEENELEKEEVNVANKNKEEEDTNDSEEEEEEEEEEEKSKVGKAAEVPRRPKKLRIVSDTASIFLHPQIPHLRIWTAEGGSSIQDHYDVLMVLTTELHHEDHVRITMEQREKDKPLYLVKAEHEWDLVFEKPTGPCMTCAWERMRARNLELQKKHKLSLESEGHVKDSQSSSGLTQGVKLVGLDEIADVLMKTIPELRKKAFSQFLVNITRELQAPKAPSNSTVSLVYTTLKSRKISQEELDRISAVFQNRDVVDQPSKLLSIVTALEHFRLDVGLLGETGCGSSSLFNCLLDLQNDKEGAASIGVTETTQEPLRYPYPECNNTILWDLPGLGRVGHLKTQSAGSSLHQAPVLPSDLPPCDVYILISPLRLSQGCIRLLQHLLSHGKSCYLVLSKADLIEEKSIAEVRKWTDEILGKLGLKENVYLVSALHPDTLDFLKLRDTLKDALPYHKRASLASYVSKLLEQDVFWKRADPCKLM
ncbi:uncharacterized protein zmp:0000000951 [Hoplias malabaricus]|uniref:uncharacterized protein zmp:0000000951 n=1 Tax=Hoplias malabaricus TaxID=27720 RepID=UPI0034636E30